MNLSYLESAMKGQFVWKKHDTKLLQTDEEYEQFSGLAVMVFVGLSKALGFDKQEVLDYLGIETEVYEHNLQAYNGNIYDAFAIHQSGGFAIRAEEESSRLKTIRKVYFKSKLVQNYIKLNYILQERLSLADLPS